MDEVEVPARLEEIMPTAIPTNEADLRKILDTIRRQIIYDTGMEVDRLRRPLRDMEITFDKLDLDQYLQLVEEEDSLKDRLEDEYTAFRTVCRAVLKRITDQAIAINKHRSFFRQALDDANHRSKERREHMDQEVLEALQDPQTQVDGENLEAWIESNLFKALQCREFDDLHLRTTFFRRLRGFLLPILAKSAFDIFERLDKCAEYARLHKGIRTEV